MKTTAQYIFIIICLISGSLLNAQSNRIQRTTLEYEDQRVDALTISIQPNRKEVQDAFDDWMDERYDTKMKGGGLFSDKNLEESDPVVISGISPDNISIFAKTEEMNGTTKMLLFASRGLNNFIEQENEAAFAGLEDLFDAFLSDYLPDYYEERVAEAEEILNDLRDDYDDVEKDIQKNEEDIQKLREDNEELREELDVLREKLRKAEEDLRKRKSARRTITRQASGAGLK